VRTLLEASQRQTEELRSQEEEMRQNMEEIQAIQEQMSRQLERNTAIRHALEAREKVLGLTTILSESDLFGTILFANDKFCEIAQYSQEELIGQPHNLIRHPDMPKEIFRQMWAEIKVGNAFNGIIKNRKKDGTHYWVDSTIVPVIEDGKIVKYIGARYHIKDDDVAEKLFFRQMRRMGLLDLVR
jgi:PAS domain S-box-containing protein